MVSVKRMWRFPFFLIRLRCQVFPNHTDQFSNSYLCTNISLGFSVSLSLTVFSLLLPWPALLDHHLLCLLFLPPVRGVTRRGLSLRQWFCAHETTVSGTRLSFSLSRTSYKRIQRINFNRIRVSSRSYFTRLVIASSQAKIRLHIRHDFQAGVLKMFARDWR